jgi:hypothetical protein
VALKAWVDGDVPDKVMRFADPSVLQFSWAEARAYTEADARGFFAHQQRARLEGSELNFASPGPVRPTPSSAAVRSTRSTSLIDVRRWGIGSRRPRVDMESQPTRPV